MNLLDVNDRPGEYPPSWYAKTADIPPPFPPLRGEAAADVCVIGAGYTGLSAAWSLAQAGFDVVVVEAQRIGFGASGRNGGQIGSGQRWDASEVEASFGETAARQLWDIAEEAKALVRQVAEEGNAQWRDGVAHAFRSSRSAEEARREAEFVADRYGYDRVEILDREAFADLVGSEQFVGGAVDWGAGHAHPLRLALALARLATDAGARIHEESRAVSITDGVVTTSEGRIKAKNVVVAANGYLGDLAPKVAARVMPINNFVLATEPLGDAMPLKRPIAVADDYFVVNYWRPTEDGRLLFGGGESYGYRFPSDIASLVRSRMTRIYPGLADAGIHSAWGGTLAITRSRLPHFSRPQPGLWSASGYSGHGVAMAMMAGRIIAEALKGEAGRFDFMSALPDPPFPGGARFRAPLLALAMTWYGLRDRLGV